MKFFNKNFWKFAAIFAVIVVLGGGVIWLAKYFEWRKSPEYQAEKYLKEMEQKYREDTYGGSTPEETLQLFIDALKNGDTDLASKYFVVDKQENERKYLEALKSKDSFNKLITDAQSLKLNKKDDKIAFFTIVNNKNIVEVQVIFKKNDFTNKWKIEEL